MITISKRYDFDAAHQLHLDHCSAAENEAMFGKCNNLHGHTYSLVVEVGGRIHPETGMVLNYFDLDKIVKPIVDGKLDHTFLNDLFENVLTTSENMVSLLAPMIFLIRLDFASVSSCDSTKSNRINESWKTI